MRRAALDSDIEQVHAIYTHPSVVRFLGHDPMPLDEFRAVFRELSIDGSFFVVEHEGEIAGFYKVVRYPGRARHVACLGPLAISPDLHGNGVGRAMLREAFEHLRDDGALRVEVYVESDNARGVRFYESLGFRIEGRLRKFYKRADEPHYVDELVMGLLLDEPQRQSDA